MRTQLRSKLPDPPPLPTAKELPALREAVRCRNSERAKRAVAKRKLKTKCAWPGCLEKAEQPFWSRFSGFKDLVPGLPDSGCLCRTHLRAFVKVANLLNRESM
jgi:hypothetical protein